jgi:hypothetical protein
VKKTLITGIGVGVLSLLLIAGEVFAQLAPVSIRGRVVAAENDAALPRVRVVVSSGDQSSAPVLTDREGRFTVDVPAAESYTVRAAKAGYAFTTMPVGAATITAARGRGIEVRLARGAAVTGRVVDATGRPVIAATVLVQEEPNTVRSQPRSGVGAQTDDRGEYRVGGLPAGRYSVALISWPGKAPEPRSPDGTGSPGGAVVPDDPRSPAIGLRAGDDSSVMDLVVPSGRRIPSPAIKRHDGPVGTSVVRGRVVGPFGEPLADAHVHLQGTAERVVMTSAEGRFVISELPAGSFTLEVSKQGYGALRYGQRRAMQGGRTIRLRADETLDRIDVALPRGSAILGAVVDEYGEPVEGIYVHALAVNVADGRTIAVPVQSGERRTDDRGRYRLFGLLPGTYLVAVSMDATVSTGVREPEGYAPVYYPGTTRLAEASKIEVEINRDLRGIDLTFSPSPTARVSGVVVDDAGKPVKDAMVPLFDRGSSDSVAFVPRFETTASDGAFALRNVSPGEYLVQVVATLEPSTDDTAAGSQVVSVTDRAPSPLTVRVSMGSTVSGRFIVEGDTDVTASRFRLKPVGPDPFTLDVSMTTVDDVGTFRLRGLRGTATLALDGAPENWYLKSLRIGGIDATETAVDFDAQSYENAELVLSSRGASIAGSVTDEHAVRVGDYAVIAFPTRRDMRLSPGRVKSVRADQDGRYRVSGLPPGEYWVAAVSALEQSIAVESTTPDPAALERLSSRAIRVAVGEGQLHAANLRLVEP